MRVNKQTKPSKTYALDLDNGTIGGYVDGLDALKQFIRKTLATPRYRYMIYNSQYGCEMESLVGQDLPITQLQSSLPRMIKDALIYDDRIRDVTGFAYRRENDTLFVSFAVSTTLGTIQEEVTV